MVAEKMVTVLQFSIKVMNLNHRHSFVNIVAEAGYISERSGLPRPMQLF